MKVCDTLFVSTVAVLLAASQVQADCLPGAIWKEDCNTCFCTQSGRVSCTRMACDTREKRDITMECSPGTRWKEDCNSCFCSRNGLRACTLMACRPNKTYRECVPGAVWKLACNTCVCHAEGRASCTRMACQKEE